MHNTLKSVFSNKNITLTYITLLRKETALKLLRNIDAGDLHKRDNIYGYIDDEKMIPFATYLVIDNKYVITRSPYETGQESHYIIVRNDVLAEYYKNWAQMIVANSQKIDTIEDINAIYNFAQSGLSDDQKKKAKEYISSIEKKMKG